jgi:negative regulator of flagellin synthesis FlgM
MKIPPTTAGVQGAKSAELADTGRAKSSSPDKVPSTGGGSDSVQLSELSTQLHAIESSLSGPEFDRTKVEDIKQAIRDGSLSVNADVVADKMLTSARELLSQGTQ